MPEGETTMKLFYHILKKAILKKR